MNLKKLIESENLQAKSYEEIVAILNERPLVDNPDPQGEVFITITPDALSSLIPFAELQAISGLNFQDWVQSLSLPNSDLESAAKRLLLAVAGRENGTLLGSINYLVEQQNRSALTDFVTVLTADDKLSPETATAIGTVMSATIPDPGYQAQVPGQSLAEQNGLGIITNEQVQEALNAPT